MNADNRILHDWGYRKPTILIIDDDASNLTVVSDYLREEDYEVLVAEDGRTGLERAGLARPDLVLLDVLMPDMDGFEACRRMKADPETRDIPVIFMTALADTENKIKGLAFGAVDYLTKPSQREEVLARVMVHLRIGELTDSLKEANASLESRVEERTAKLASANRDLEAQIAERRQAEDALRKSEERFRALYEQNPTMYFTLDALGSVLSVNPFGAEQLGYTPEELTGQPILNLFHPDDKDSVQEQFLKCLGSTGPIWTWEFRKVRKDGSVLWVREKARAVLGDDGQTLVLVVCEDITDRKQAEEEVSKSRDFLDKIINSIGDPIFVKDRKHCWVLLNDAYCHFMGHPRDHLIGKADCDFFPKEQAKVFWEKDEIVFATGEENVNEEQFTNAQGVMHTIVTKKTLYRDDKGEEYIVGLINDITERKNLEIQLRQAVKMEAIGTLAGGVAHDFNNLLTVVNGYCDLLLGRIPPGDPLRRNIEQIQTASSRAASLTSQLLAFSRKHVIQPEVLDLNIEIKETEKMLRRLIGEDIDLVAQTEQTLRRVMADPGLIQQVIMNLAINARDAMPRGGKLTIETENVQLDESYTRQHMEVEPGPYVLLAVSDTGIGMDKHTLSHIFEPFFTTKEKGKGTGLGLATVYGIVKQSGGNIWVYSEPGRGSSFKIYLPVVEETIIEKQEEDSPKPVTGSETILLVEDDDIVRNIAGTSLRLNGYTVLEAQNGDEALSICQNRGGSIDLLITDVVMPGMNGREVAQAVEAVCPTIKVLFISGYTDNAIVHHGVLDEGTEFLQKPFTPHSLAHKIRNILERV